MRSHLPAKLSLYLPIIAVATVFSLTSCSDRPPKRDFQAEQMSAAAAKPTLSGQDTFFDGKLLVEANLGQGFGGRGGPGGGAGMHGGPGGGGGRRGGGKHGGPGGGGPDGDGERRQDSDGESSGGGSSIRESNMPPVALRLRLTNTSHETVEVTFLLCKSELGDFAVRPEKLALAADQSAEADPMTSRLGLASAALVLNVKLRLGDKVEQKALVLKPVPPDEPAGSANANH